MRLNLAVQVDELGVAVLVLAPFVLLCVRLQAVAHLVEELADGDVADRVALATKLICEGAGRLRRPAHLAHRVPPALWLDEVAKSQKQPRLGVDRLGPAGSWRPDPSRDLQLSNGT